MSYTTPPLFGDWDPDDALDHEPALRALKFRIFGTGEHEALLKERAQRTHPNVEFFGFSTDIGRELSESDLLLHLCPQEPFGLAILEAMSAGVPVLVPNQGGRCARREWANRVSI